MGAIWRRRVLAGSLVGLAVASLVGAGSSACGARQARPAAIGPRLLSQMRLAGLTTPRSHSLGAGHSARPLGSRRALDGAAEVRLVTPGPRHAPVDTAIQLEFSRPMEISSVLPLFSIEPAVDGALEWPDDRTVVFHPSAPLAYQTTYRVAVGGFPLGRRSLLASGSFTFATVWRPPAVPYPFTLTFDDCASAPAIQAILSALADRDLHAIFFPTGLCRDQFPWLVPTLLAAGHRVCNHTYSHPDLSRLSNDAIRSEIQRGVSVGCDLLRPPYGALDRAGRVASVAASLGYRIQLWDVDTRDWAGTPSDVMVAMIRARGGTVLMHMQGAHTVEAIRSL